MSTYIAATQKLNTSTIPVWFMRQAGRYLPEYMDLKARFSFREMSHTPELMADVTLQPLRRFPLDAAIMFSDILTCLEYMGAHFQFTDQGPKLDLCGADVLMNLKSLDPQKDMPFICKGIGQIKSELQKPLIGFVGAPFTLASYLVEGNTSKEFKNLKTFIFQDPKSFFKAMDHLAIQVGNYLVYQIESGVDAVQIFDSWVGVLGYDDYEKHVLPHVAKMISIAKSKKKVPVTLYSQPTSHLLPLLTQTGADVLSVDWRLPLDQIAKLTDHKVAIQGNLDPNIVCLPWSDAKSHVERVLNEAKHGEILQQFIFNVGHGVTPSTKVDTIKHVIDFVHNFR